MIGQDERRCADCDKRIAAGVLCATCGERRRIAPICVPTAQLAAEFIASADRNLAMLTADAGGDVSINDVRAMVHALCRNFAQGLQGRVLP
jgi:hypothetical protein